MTGLLILSVHQKHQRVLEKLGWKSGECLELLLVLYETGDQLLQPGKKTCNKEVFLRVFSSSSPLLLLLLLAERFARHERVKTLTSVPVLFFPPLQVFLESKWKQLSLKPFVKGTDMVHGHSFPHGKASSAGQRSRTPPPSQRRKWLSGSGHIIRATDTSEKKQKKNKSRPGISHLILSHPPIPKLSVEGHAVSSCVFCHLLCPKLFTERIRSVASHDTDMSA